MSIEIPKTKEAFDKLSPEEQKRIHDRDWSEAKAVQSLLEKESSNTEALDDLLAKFESPSETTSHFTAEQYNEASEKLTMSVDDMKSVLANYLQKFKDGNYFKAGYDQELVVPAEVNKPIVLEYIAKALGGKIRYSEENPETIEAIDFVNSGEGMSNITRPLDGENANKVDSINYLGIFPSEGRTVKMRMSVKRFSKEN